MDREREGGGGGRKESSAKEREGVRVEEAVMVVERWQRETLSFIGETTVYISISNILCTEAY